MHFSESFRQAIDSLKANKLRSTLTMLGIIMGVFSVITIMAIGNAAQAYMDSQFEKLGANVISITYKSRNVSSRDWLLLDDINVIKRAAPEIKNINAYIQRTGSVRAGAKTRDAAVLGVTSQYKSFSPVEMVSGRFINDIDFSSRANVVVINESFAIRYFKRTDLIGMTIPLKASGGAVLKLRIIGVTKSEGNLFENMFDNENFPTVIMVPLSTLQSFYNVKKLDEISVSVVEKDKLTGVGRRIVKILEYKHGTTDSYLARNSADIQKTLSNVMGVVSAVLLVVAVITLIVGGIGIINILLVSVTERIREIGVRKALGARKKDIIMQFITESIVMTGLSGIAGIILGIITGGVISANIKIPPVIDVRVIILSFAGSIALGMIFGVYPAKKAADLDPIESLRYE